MQVRNKQRSKVKGDGFYRPKDEKSNEKQHGKDKSNRRKEDEEEDFPAAAEIEKLNPQTQQQKSKGNKDRGMNGKPAAENKKQDEKVSKEKQANRGRKGSVNSRTTDENVEDDAERKADAGNASDTEEGIETSTTREITLAMTRSGAVNVLSTRFLRDSDEAVQARKLRATEPFQHREIVPRIYDHLPFPVRQDWSHIKSAEELDKMENEYFEKWLDETYKGRRIEHLSPFEHNLEVWRQLWRVLEKSDIIVLLADMRDPLLHIPIALHKHVTEFHKIPIVIVLTKCDLVSEEHVARWKRFLEQAFDPNTTKIVSNSGKCQSTHGIGGYSARRKILHARATKAQIAEMHRQSRHILDVAMEFAKSKRPELDVVAIGLIGQPNTGKSSLVNSILGRHAVSVSRTCGHTKHWQTQNIKNDEGEVIATIIDSPGLIFPMAVDEAQQDSVSPRAWFECAGLYPIAQIRETFSAIRFAGERVDLPRMYNLKLNVDDYGEHWSPYAFCGSLADKRGYTLQRGGGAPDMHRAGLETIYDICDGIILICFPPPDIEEWRSKTKYASTF